MREVPESRLRGEIRRVLPGPGGTTEVLLLVRGAGYAPEDPRTFLHLRVVDRLRRVSLRRLAPGTEVTGRVFVTARFVEEIERPFRSLSVDRRPGSGRIPHAIRIVGHDTEIAGEVVRHLDGETFLLDAGLPLVVRVPAPFPGLPPEGRFVAFLLHEKPALEIF